MAEILPLMGAVQSLAFSALGIAIIIAITGITIRWLEHRQERKLKRMDHEQEILREK
jgi:hypothetical protein